MRLTLDEIREKLLNNKPMFSLNLQPKPQSKIQRQLENQLLSEQPQLDNQILQADADTQASPVYIIN